MKQENVRKQTEKTTDLVSRKDAGRAVDYRKP